MKKVWMICLALLAGFFAGNGTEAHDLREKNNSAVISEVTSSYTEEYNYYDYVWEDKKELIGSAIMKAYKNCGNGLCAWNYWKLKENEFIASSDWWSNGHDKLNIEVSASLSVLNKDLVEKGCSYAESSAHEGTSSKSEHLAWEEAFFNGLEACQRSLHNFDFCVIASSKTQYNDGLVKVWVTVDGYKMKSQSENSTSIYTADSCKEKTRLMGYDGEVEFQE